MIVNIPCLFTDALVAIINHFVDDICWTVKELPSHKGITGSTVSEFYSM